TVNESLVIWTYGFVATVMMQDDLSVNASLPWRNSQVPSFATTFIISTAAGAVTVIANSSAKPNRFVSIVPPYTSARAAPCLSLARRSLQLLICLKSRRGSLCVLLHSANVLHGHATLTGRAVVGAASR